MRSKRIPKSSVKRSVARMLSCVKSPLAPLCPITELEGMFRGKRCRPFADLGRFGFCGIRHREAKVLLQGEACRFKSKCHRVAASLVRHAAEDTEAVVLTVGARRQGRVLGAAA